MKIPVENKILAGFVITALALGGAGWLSYRATEDFIAAQGWVKTYPGGGVDVQCYFC